MAKKKAAQVEFVMSREILEILQEDPTLKGKEVIELLQERFPDETINENSASVAFSNARRKLGIGKSHAATGGKGAAARTDYEALRAARDFVSTVGDTDTAIATLKQLEALQLT